jgi:hypothetical protein
LAISSANRPESARDASGSWFQVGRLTVDDLQGVKDASRASAQRPANTIPADTRESNTCRCAGARSLAAEAPDSRLRRGPGPKQSSNRPPDQLAEGAHSPASINRFVAADNTASAFDRDRAPSRRTAGREPALSRRGRWDLCTGDPTERWVSFKLVVTLHNLRRQDRARALD